MVETLLDKVESEIEEEKSLLVENPLYRGLRKVEDKIYAGGTSIKYWM